MYTCDRLETNKCMPVTNYSLGAKYVNIHTLARATLFIITVEWVYGFLFFL
jgi:hypothetical protein